MNVEISDIDRADRSPPRKPRKGLAKATTILIPNVSQVFGFILVRLITNVSQVYGFIIVRLILNISQVYCFIIVRLITNVSQVSRAAARGPGGGVSLKPVHGARVRGGPVNKIKTECTGFSMGGRTSMGFQWEEEPRGVFGGRRR